MEKSLYSERQRKLQELLRQIRVEAGLRQVDLAEKLGEPQSFVSKYENGEMYARKWTDYLANEVRFPLKRITLFHAPMGFEYGKEYILAFEFPHIKKSPEPETFKRIRSIRRIVKGWLRDPKGILWQNDSFRDVYIKAPDGEWLDSWVFQAYVPKGADKEFCWVLYDSAGFQMSDDTKLGGKDNGGEPKPTAKSKTDKMWDSLALKAKNILEKTPDITREDLAAELAVKENFYDKGVRSVSTIEKELSKRGIHTKRGRRQNP